MDPAVFAVERVRVDVCARDICKCIVTGKNGGVALDATRANALWRLGFASHSSLKETVPLLEMVLYGAPEPPNETLAVECQLL